MMIKKVHTIKPRTIVEFNNELDIHINKMQKEGLKVDIQYSNYISNGVVYYSALLIGRGQETWVVNSENHKI